MGGLVFFVVKKDGIILFFFRCVWVVGLVFFVVRKDRIILFLSGVFGWAVWYFA